MKQGNTADYWAANNLIKPKQRIVCAAIRNKITDEIIIGVRHFDSFMRQRIEKCDAFQDRMNWRKADQGFVDQFGDFLSREEALIIAKENGQIFRRCGGDEGALFSENLY